MYSLKLESHVSRTFSKLSKKDKPQLEMANKKIKQILENPHRFKPLRAPMENKRRVQIGSSVLIYRIDEEHKIVEILDYDHHDNIYL